MKLTDMTDADVWFELEYYVRNGGLRGGLCHLIVYLTDEDRDRAGGLYRRLRDRFDNGEAFYWPPGATAPRIKACQILRREALRREGAK